MILHLKNGQLCPPPASPALARKRSLQLAAECSRIDAQLKDSERMTQMSATNGTAAYADWRRRAEQALRMHNLELRLLTEWLERESRGMLRRARDLLTTLVDDEVEFSESELEFIFALDHFTKSACGDAG